MMTLPNDTRKWMRLLLLRIRVPPLSINFLREAYVGSTGRHYKRIIIAQFGCFGGNNTLL